MICTYTSLEGACDDIVKNGDGGGILCKNRPHLGK